MVSSIKPSIMSSLGLSRFLPEPRSTVGNGFRILVGEATTAAARGMSSLNGIDPQFMDLINKQIQVQMQMQLVSLYSNLEKSKHETEMAAIRNVRVG